MQVNLSAVYQVSVSGQVRTLHCALSFLHALSSTLFLARSFLHALSSTLFLARPHSLFVVLSNAPTLPCLRTRGILLGWRDGTETSLPYLVLAILSFHSSDRKSPRSNYKNKPGNTGQRSQVEQEFICNWQKGQAPHSPCTLRASFHTTSSTS